MPTTTNPTTAEIAYLERDIAEGVMGWDGSRGGGIFVDRTKKPYRTFSVGCGSGSWSPWNDPAAALAMLERLAMLNPPEIILPWYRIERNGPTFTVSILHIPGTEATAPGPHYGPAVCLLAEKVMEGR